MTTVAPKVCSVEGCDTPAKSRGWCGTHYARWKKGQPLEAPVRGREVSICSVVTCERRVAGRGLCNTHWKQVVTYGLEEPREIRAWSAQDGPCKSVGCSADAMKVGFCDTHYQRSWKGSLIDGPPLRGAYDKNRPCVIMGCDRTIESRTLMCKKHDSLMECYGLTSVQLQMLWDRGCEFCGATERLHIDHDHSCCDRKVTGSKRTCGNCVRGCLCNDCNLGMGFFHDDAERLDKAAAYLRARVTT